MDPQDIQKLRRLTDFEALVDYLRDELEWPIEVEDADAITFDYDPAELGIDPKHAVKIESIKQIRPLSDNQPWGVFYVQFESKRLPVVVLRRILRSLVPKSRRRDPHQPVWGMSDLLFISAQGAAGARSVSFAHFRQRPGRVAELRTFSWDAHETHFYYLKNLNLAALRWPDDESDADAWRERWRDAFTVEHRYTITTSQTLAREMARHAATVRDLVNEVYALETDDGPLHRLYAGFKEVLLHDLDPGAFADMVAQTVAYGLFSAATQTDDLTFDRVVELIPNTNPFLKDLLAELTTQGAVDGSTADVPSVLTIDLDELGVDQLVELLRQTNIEAILQDFGKQTGWGREDPVVHFYELFLSEYDKAQKVQRGVFYTPDPVVSYIVRSVDHLLKTEFGLPDGLADTSVDPETGEPLVQILDPAAGTGTFLAHVIDQIEHTVKAKPGADWNAYVAEGLLPRLHGFELMMAPYAVAHMKLGLKLRQTGYDFSGDERLRVYLTNTLEEPVEMHETLALGGFLSKEANQAARVKRQVPVTVVIGNPPYSRSSANRGKYIEDLMNCYKAAVREEQNIQALSDDYIKFIRFAHSCFERTGCGIIGMITNHTYLSGLIHRGMREELLKSFSSIYILNLHGSALLGETTPEGNKDENVFDIMQGVAIAFFIKKPDLKGSAYLQYADLWGLRNSKYSYLLRKRIDITTWKELKPTVPHFFFVPKDFSFEKEYKTYVSLSEVFGFSNVGGKPGDDSLLVSLRRDEVQQKLKDFIETYDAGEATKITEAKRNLIQTLDSFVLQESQIEPYNYRPFDHRWVYYDPQIWTRAVTVVKRHCRQDNLLLLSTKIVKGDDFQHVFVSKLFTDVIFLSNKTSTNCFVFPLYFYTTPESTQGTLFATGKATRKLNFRPRFIIAIKEMMGLDFKPDCQSDLKTTLGPEDVLHYAYAVFHSPAYRQRYAEFLKIDFPRLPLTSDLGLFRALVGLGADLVALHLLEDDYPAASWNVGRIANSPLQHPITTFVERETGTKMGKFSKRSCYKDGRVYLDTSSLKHSSYFDGVPKDVWEFQIGGYQVLRKWLYDRRETPSQPGRALTKEDIAHYQRVVVALKETMRLMGEIDEVIDGHGGWPVE